MKYPNIKLTEHILQNRNSSKISRIEYLNENNLNFLIKESYTRGLTSFRNKGVFVISIKLENNAHNKYYKSNEYNKHYKYYNFLCELRDNDLIFITCIINDKFWKSFKKVSKRINIINVNLPRINEKQKQILKKQRYMDKIEKEISKEDQKFLNYFNSLKESNKMIKGKK